MFLRHNNPNYGPRAPTHECIPFRQMVPMGHISRHGLSGIFRQAFSAGTLVSFTSSTLPISLVGCFEGISASDPALKLGQGLRVKLIEFVLFVPASSQLPHTLAPMGSRYPFNALRLKVSTEFLSAIFGVAPFNS